MNILSAKEFATKDTPLLTEKLRNELLCSVSLSVAQWHSSRISLSLFFSLLNSYGLQFIDPSKHLDEDKIFLGKVWEINFFKRESIE